MHSYATDSKERENVILGIAVISILISWLLGQALTKFDLSIPWWLDAPAVLGFFGLFYKLMDKYLWKCKIIRIICGIKVPDLNGKWIGYLVSSYDDSTLRRDVNVNIAQKWTKISIIFENDSSRSHSIIASISVENPNQITMSYEYRNEPKYDAVPTLQMHRGFTNLKLSKDGLVFDGDYYSGRGRQNYGTLHLVQNT